MTKIISFDEFLDRDFFEQVCVRAEQSRQNEPETSVIARVQPNGPSNLEIELKDGATETAFWQEVFKWTLLDGDAFDNFLAGRPITE